MVSDTTIPAGRAGTYPLGDREVRRIGYGAMQLPGRGVMGPPRDHDEAVRVLRRAVDLGVNHIDTAARYGASAPFETDKPPEAYSDWPPEFQPVRADWPPRT